jgi:peptide chain release factor 1
MFDRLASMEKRFEQLEAEMSRPGVADDPRHLRDLARERSRLEGGVRLYREYRTKEQALREARELIAGDDADLAELAREEISALEPALATLTDQLRIELIPKDPYDEKDVVMEIRAGTGGAEASLFVGDLLGMYTRWAGSHGWRHEVLEATETDLGGFREVIFSVKGERVYSRLKHESGVHRVQRVPQTETQGRIASTPPPPPWRSCPRPTRSTSRSTRTTSGWTPSAPRGPAGSRSTPPSRRCG